MGMRALVSGQPALLCRKPGRTRTRTRPGAASSSSFSPTPTAPSLSLGLGTTKPKPKAIIPVLAKDQRLLPGLDFTARAIPPLHALPLPPQPQDAHDDDTTYTSSSDTTSLAVALEKEEDEEEEEEDNALFSGLYPGTVGIDLILLALPAVLGQAIDPMAQLMETAYIGKLGALELASAGIGMAIFNILSKIFNIPLLSIATSFVAEDISNNASKHSSSGKLELPSVSSALILAAGIGTVEALALFLGSGLFLKLMGVSLIIFEFFPPSPLLCALWILNWIQNSEFSLLPVSRKSLSLVLTQIFPMYKSA